MPWELLVGLASCHEPSLAGQSSYWPGFQQKQHSNQHIPVDCFRFQQSNIFLWKSLSSEKSLQSRIFPCLGASGTTKFPAGCVFRERAVHRLPWVEIKSRLPLKIAGHIPGKGGLWSEVAPSSSGVKHHPPSVSQMQVQQAVNTSFAHCGDTQMPQCQWLWFGERWIMYWMPLNLYPWILFYAFVTNTVAAWISCWLNVCFKRYYFLKIKPMVLGR